MKKSFSIVLVFLFLILPSGHIRAAAEMEAKVFHINYASADGIAEIVKKLLSPDGKISSDARTNILVVMDYPEKLAAIEEVVRQLDARIEQVAIEAAIVETSAKALKDLGFRWGTGPVLFYKGSKGISSKDFEVLFSALDSDSQTNISSHARVVTQERKPASINISSQTGIFLLVTASTHPDGTITLDIEPADLLTRVAATSVNIKNGETVAIGESDFSQETESQGTAAERKSGKSRKTLIFISAKVLK